MATSQYVYLFTMVVGLGYVLISSIVGHIGGDADLDAGGHDFDAGHGDAGGGVDGTAEPGLHFSPFSPLVIASFASAFGAVGLITSAFMPVIIHVPLSIGGGLAIGFLIAWLMAKLNQMSAAETTVTTANLVGSEALVSVYIPASGYGEITYETMGTRFNAPAQSEGKVEIPKDSMVTITRIIGNTFFVKPSVDEKLRSIK